MTLNELFQLISISSVVLAVLIAAIVLHDAANLHRCRRKGHVWVMVGERHVCRRCGRAFDMRLL